MIHGKWKMSFGRWSIGVLNENIKVAFKTQVIFLDVAKEIMRL